MQAPDWFRSALEQRPESATLEVAGAPIHYLAWGERDRPGLLFVHGGAAHAHWWSFLAPLFADDYRVVAMDLSGHGDSGRREEYRPALWAQELVEVSAHAGFAGPPVVVGHSMGGLVTIATGALHGDRLAGAVLIDSPVERPDPAANAEGRRLLRPRTHPDEESARASFRPLPDQPGCLPYVLDHVARHSLRRVEDGVGWKFDPAALGRFRPDGARPYLPDVSCRLAIFRAQHGLVTPETGDFVLELLGRDAPIVEIPAAHHHMMLDQPLALVAALRVQLAAWGHGPSGSAGGDSIP